MGPLSGYLRLQIVIVTAVVLSIGALTVFTGTAATMGLLVLFGLVSVGFLVVFVLFSVR